MTPIDRMYAGTERLTDDEYIDNFGELHLFMWERQEDGLPPIGPLTAEDTYAQQAYEMGLAGVEPSALQFATWERLGNGPAIPQQQHERELAKVAAADAFVDAKGGTDQEKEALAEAFIAGYEEGQAAS